MAGSKPAVIAFSPHPNKKSMRFGVTGGGRTHTHRAHNTGLCQLSYGHPEAHEEEKMNGAQGGSRTRMPFPALPPQGSVSAYSTTWAWRLPQDLNPHDRPRKTASYPLNEGDMKMAGSGRFERPRHIAATISFPTSANRPLWHDPIKTDWRTMKESNLRAPRGTICFRNSANRPLWQLSITDTVK